VAGVKRLLLLACVLGVFAIPATAHAAVPCRDRIYNEWYATGKISTSYPLACYRDALRNIPLDAKVYSNLVSDIQSAMQAARRRLNGLSVPGTVGAGRKTSGLSGTKGAVMSLGPSSADHGHLEASAASGSPISSLPLPILVLGGVAIALAAAGAIGSGVRHVRRRS
jgi:hypothetical protein